MLGWSAILACMPVEHSSAMPDPDEFDQQLRNLTSGQAEPARFTELSAEERARRNSSPPPPAKLSWRAARKAKQLRRPVGDPGGVAPDGGSPGGQARRRGQRAQRTGADVRY